jgi:hypothetical protein
MVGDVVKFFVRVIGWLSLDMIVYQGNSMISKRRKREDFSEDHLKAEIDDEGEDWIPLKYYVKY